MKNFLGLRLAAAVAFVCLASSAFAQYTTVSASHVGGTATPAANATIYWQPVTAARIGTTGGQILGVPMTATVVNGAFTLSLPDTSLSDPANPCFAVTVIDNSTGGILLGAGLAKDGSHVNTGGPYGCVQPSGATWSFDTYIPNSAPTAPIVAGPTGPQGTSGTNCASGSSPGTCTFNGTLIATQMTAGVMGGIYQATNFGVVCDGSTDDSTALNSIGSFAATLSGGRTITVSFPSNSICVHASSITTWLVPNLHIVGNGARLKFTGTGKQIYLHSAASETDNFELLDFVLQGNANSTYGIYSDALIARGRIRLINIQDQNTACIYAGGTGSWQLMNEVDLTCSSNMATAMGVAQTTTPPNGIILGDTGAPFTNNRSVKITAEGITSGIALWCKLCYEDNFTGTGEGSATGLQIESLSSNLIFLAFDTESNSVQDALDKGTRNKFINFTSLGTFNTQSATREEFNGGIYHNIADDGGSSYTSFHDLVYGYPSGGTISGYAGVATVFEHVVNNSTGVPYWTQYTGGDVASMFFSNHSTNTSARNWCFAPDQSAFGNFDLRVTPSNTTLGCNAGSITMEFAPNGDVLFPNSGTFGQVWTGSNVIYRCTSAGTLPVGALTADATKCGTSVDTKLRSN